MPADALTKALSPGKFGSMLALLNLVLPPMPDRVSSLSWSRGILAVLVFWSLLDTQGTRRNFREPCAGGANRPSLLEVASLHGGHCESRLGRCQGTY